MLHIKDPLFLVTASMIDGSGEMPPVFQHLADWTHQHMDVTILNIAYHRAQGNASPRLPATVEATCREPVNANHAPSIYERMRSVPTMARALVLQVPFRSGNRHHRSLRAARTRV